MDVVLPTLDTPRLLLRPFSEDDLDGYAVVVGDDEVCRYLGHPPRSREDAWRDLAFFLGHGVLRRWTVNAVVGKASGRLLGRCGLYRPEGWPGLEVGWTLARAEWGRGYATEAAAAWRDWAFRTLDLAELVSVVHVDNVRSARVARRIGHRRLREIEVRGHPCVLWGQTRADWTAEHG
ncbi:MAG TPA: GNAT family N-acetyltransferase [Mycobacteriales bacterium]|nr:GNAT family N-acetyltransferase [Mycobacteriales bacterium]